VPDGAVVSYAIEDGAAWELGRGTYDEGEGALARSLLSSSTGELLDLSGDAVVFITALARDVAFTLQGGVSGKPVNSQIQPLGIADRAVTLGQWAAIAAVAATATTVATLRKTTPAGETSTLGTLTWGPGDFVATVDISAAAVSAGEMVSIAWPAAADATLGNIGVMAREGLPGLSTLKIALILGYGDSRVGGTWPGDRAGLDAPRPDMLNGVTDFVETGVPDADYGTAHGITEVGLTSQLPFQMFMNTMGTESHLSPFEGAAKYLLDNGFDVVIFLGCGWGSSHFIVNGEDLTVHAKLKAAWGLAQAQAMFAGADIRPLVWIYHGVNDMTSASDPSALAAGLYAATLGFADDIRTVEGWETAPIGGVAVSPEQMGSLGSNRIGDTAMRVALLKEVESAYWVQYPYGIAGLHDGDLEGTLEERQAMVRAGGYEHIGPMMSVALGNEDAPEPVITIAENLERTEGANTEIPLPVDQRVFWHTIESDGDFLELSGDIELLEQVARPVGGAYPAYDDSTAANNERSWTVHGTTAYGRPISATRNLTIVEAEAPGSTTYLAYHDPSLMAPAAKAWGNLGETTGDGTTGGGLEITGVGGYAGGKMVLGGPGIPPVWPDYLVNVGATSVRVRQVVKVGGTYPAYLLGAMGHNGKTSETTDDNVGQATYGIAMGTDGTCTLRTASGNRTYGSFAALTVGNTYTIGFDIDKANEEVTFYVNGEIVIGPIGVDPFLPIPENTHVGAGGMYYDTGFEFGLLTVEALAP
jgi:hypothetical protein